MNVDDRPHPNSEPNPDPNAQGLQPLPELTSTGAKPLPDLGRESGASPNSSDMEADIWAEANETEPEDIVGAEVASASQPTASQPTASQSIEPQAAEETAPEPAAAPLEDPAIAEQQAQLAELTTQREQLQTEIAELQQQRQSLLTEHGKGVYELVMDSLQTLSEHKGQLEADITKLEKRRDRVIAQMQQTFIGTSEDIAIRLQGFKDYLLGSLQDLAAAAEQMDLPSARATTAPPRRAQPNPESEMPAPQFAKQRFQEQRRQVKACLEEYRNAPDYYGPPWQLRRTFEPIHADRVQQWFFKQGGRGTVRSLGSRLQNILIASATISILRRLYGERLNILVLANTPERLGEWRRGLQDCLGISRSDYGPTRGITLFESPQALAQKADRLVEQKQLPLIVMDETEEVISLDLLQFPLWLAFAPDPSQMSSYMY
ncbi:MAG: DUF3086 domain-containing protein [Cyanobacteria bacterium P01_G01_bin.54]